ncbi:MULTISPECIES: STAS domain-containing protein [unclassified Amycolatopsis]|uniref:STAS domain-containing protein n=1 Tax=unclassified Amycolatopsis TaxID=2618356 RepID=UPI002E1DE0DD|nr:MULTISPECIES: STAS domain-containing protein [unclassified Amycolatopsis]
MTDQHTAPVIGSTGDAGIVTVRCAGDLDLGCAPRMRQALLAAVRDCARGVVADLSAATYCDSLIFSVLLETHRAARARGVPWALAADRVTVARPLAILGLDGLLPLYEDLDAAVTALGGEPATRAC